MSEAGLKEAQRTLIHLISYHVKDLHTMRSLVLEAMQYCYSGRSDLVTVPDGSQLLDGLFSTYFGNKVKKIPSPAVGYFVSEQTPDVESLGRFHCHIFKLFKRREFLYPGNQRRGY